MVRVGFAKGDVALKEPYTHCESIEDLELLATDLGWFSAMEYAHDINASIHDLIGVWFMVSPTMSTKTFFMLSAGIGMTMAWDTYMEFCNQTV